MALLPRIKTWSSTEDLVYSDINAEFDNILNNLAPLYIDDYSTNVTQMQTQTDPGEVGSESKATTLAGELARLRFMMKEITGQNYWYESPATSLEGLSNAVGGGLPANRIVSGRVLTTSEQPAFLVPNGAARTVKVDGTPTAFAYYIEGSQYTIASDVTVTNLTAAPSSNNTCLVNDSLATADEWWTKYTGEDGTTIPVDNMGSEISNLVGKYAGFKLAGAATEYFIAYVKSSTELTKARRGYFFDSSDNPVPRTGYTDNDVITLMKLTWVFAKTDGTLTATYTNPIWSDDEPTSPAVNDYWFDYSADKWKVYGIGSYGDADATLVGICLQDATNTIAARSFEFFKPYDDTNTVELFTESNTQAKSRFQGAQISVWGETIKNDHNLHTWDMTLDLESGVTENSSTYYYFYVTETGDKIISDKKPHDRREDLRGYYHPSQSWRCVGRALNNGSSNLTEVESYFKRYDGQVIRAASATDVIQPRDQTITLSGATFTTYLPPAASYKGRTLTYVHGGTSLTQVYTLDGNASETIDGATTVALYTNAEAVSIRSTGSAWVVVDHRWSSAWVDAGVMTVSATTLAPTKSDNPTVDKVLWRRDGSDMIARYTFVASGTTNAAAGTGDYKFALPGSVSAATTGISLYTTLVGNAAAARPTNVIGTALTGVAGSIGVQIASLYDANYFRIMGNNNSGGVNGALCATCNANPTAASVSWHAEVRVPISGWLP